MSQHTVKEPANAFEEQLELSNITDLRRDLLRKVEEIQQNPAIRLLILKHGRPQAVLMSADAYDAVKNVVKRFLAESEGLSREQIIGEAIDEFEEERSSVPADDELSATAGSEISASSEISAR